MKYFLFILLFINIKVYPFNIKITDIKNKKALIYIAVFNQKKGFPYKGKKGVFVWKGSPIEAKTGVFTGLPDGNYAIAVFQDIDGNGKLSKWFFGKPREPYGLLLGFKKPNKKPNFSKYSKDIPQNSTVKIKLWEP